MKDNNTAQFIERLKLIIPTELYEEAIKFFYQDKALSIRINTLKVYHENVLNALNQANILYKEVPWYKDALEIEYSPLFQRNRGLSSISPISDLTEKGFIYQQGLSSMLVPLVLNPKTGDKVLDCCSAPGSKATQISALMKNEGELVALEKVKDRFYRLKSVIELLGATNATCHLTDARRFRPKGELFDKILVDAPCSSEARFNFNEETTYKYWSLRKIKEMQEKQKGILLSSFRLLKKGGTLVYSTCTFAPEENECVIDWLFKKYGEPFRIEPIELSAVKSYPAITEWKGKKLNEQVKNCFRVLPTDLMEGFFITKIIKE